MKFLVKSFLFFIFLIQLCFSFSNIKVGQKVEAISVPNQYGKLVSIGGIKNKVQVILFFSIDNEFSMQALKKFSDISINFKKVSFSAVNIDPKAKHVVLSRTKNVSGPILFDSKRTLYKYFGVFVIPSVAIIKKDSTLSGYLPMYDKYTFKEKLSENINLALGKITKKQFADKQTSKANLSESKEKKHAVRLYNMALFQFKDNEALKGLENLKKAYKLNPKDKKVAFKLAEVYLDMEKIQEAKQILVKLKAKLAFSKNYLLNWGRVLANQGKLDQAIENFQSIIRMNRAFPRVHFELGKVYEKQGLLKKAIAEYKLELERIFNIEKAKN